MHKRSKQAASFRRGNSLIYFLPSIVFVLWLFMQHQMKKVLVCRTKRKKIESFIENRTSLLGEIIEFSKLLSSCTGRHNVVNGTKV